MLRPSTLLSVVLLLMLSAFAQQVPEPPKPALADDPAARQLVRRIIANELRAEKADHTHWMYLDRMKEPGKDVVKEVVQSNSANLELLTARNGRPITEAERRKELQRLQKLTTDPNAQREQWREEREDAEKAQRMLQMLPEAFRYRIASRDGHRVTLSFVPDPQFRPASREATVFHAMAGTMVLDTQQQRLVVMTGRLIDDVKFG